MEHPPQLVVRAAALALGGRAILRDVDLELARGEVVALLGASGCGKTTLLRSIAGLASLDGGGIAIGGEDVTRSSAQQRGVGVVFQHYALFPNLSVLENIEFGLLAEGAAQAEATARAEELLQLVELGEQRDARPARLSGGQRQRVALARALARKPSLLLMDEPFSALDESFRVPLRRSFRRLQRQLQQTCLVVTHDRAEAFELADRVAVMFDGRIAQCDTPAVLWRQPATRQVATFLGAFNLIAAPAAPGTLRRDAGWWALPIDALHVRSAGRADGFALRARVVESWFGQQRASVDLQTEAGDTLTLSRALDEPPLAAGDWVELGADPAVLQYLPT
ncbi:MAG TPA: ABC transporter ATP-binding protein [Burkholderiaceae bacterium]|jgi:ABC-type Fe3+/spermidine/putrescine transport system ATPase subunit|nr:ABC transporter ATP-binding protein [Burkholderiaceae bacterium]